MREKRSFRLLSPSLSLPSSHTRSSCARFFGYRSIFRLLPCWFFDLTIVLAVFLLLKPLAFFLMYLELFWGAFLAGTKVRLPVLIEQFTVLSTCDRISISPHSRSSAVLTYSIGTHAPSGQRGLCLRGPREMAFGSAAMCVSTAFDVGLATGV